MGALLGALMSLLFTLLLACSGGSSGSAVDSAQPIPLEELVCDDGQDQDQDGALDCDDSDCKYAAATGLEGACTNKKDMRKYLDLNANVEWNRCVPGCLVDEDCNTTCLSDNTGLSQECSRCFAELVTCFISNCAAECAEQPPTAACGECVDANCNADYATCFGTPACSGEYGCADTIDNDGNGLTDAEDPECQAR